MALELIQLATEAKNNAYNRYSRFRVGASVMTNEGKIFNGIILIELLL